MRVLHVIPTIDPRGGGPIVALAGLARAQASEGLEVKVLHGWRAGDNLGAVESLASAGVRVRGIGPCYTPLLWRPGMGRAVRQAVRESDVVHIHAIWESILHHAARAAQAMRRPYVVRACGMLDPWSLAQSRLRKAIFMRWRVRTNLDRASAIHCSTRIEKQQVELLKLHAPAIVEPNGVELDEFQSLPARGTFRGRYPQIGDRPLVVFLGRIHPGKGLEYLVPAIAKLASSRAMLAVVGPDSESHEAAIRGLAARHGVAERVLFTGILRGADRVAALADADLFALPSDHENFGVAVVEALAAGTPVIVSDQVNIHPEIAAAKVGGVVRTDAAAVAAEIDRWLADADLRRQAAQRARPFVWENYDWRTIARRWARRYETLRAQAGQSAPAHGG